MLLHFIYVLIHFFLVFFLVCLWLSRRGVVKQLKQVQKEWEEEKYTHELLSNRAERLEEDNDILKKMLERYKKHSESIITSQEGCEKWFEEFKKLQSDIDSMNASEK
ncbi:hypothetical protein QNI19_23700 [Cytophagaceae bacterium DM2B3-1]|uniref:Uncharacterized protein n=1 Tax=Xanthocytophaga flava TaxID=3048013 RepID=A0ABT7CQE0_9BACT|nr:hypothetical protein [Xanthocytophaga flavus]MDJ1495960.1 hypothetical protein [Xanthocytophaga flavus]